MRTNDELLEQAKEYLDESYYLIHIHRDSRLNKDQVNALVRGDIEELYADSDDWYFDELYESCKYEIMDKDCGLLAEINATDEERNEFINSSQFDELRYMIEERDESNWVKDMAWGQVLLRIRIGDDLVFDRSWAQAPGSFLKRLGIDPTPENLTAFDDISTNCYTEGGTQYAPFLLFAADVSDMHELRTSQDAVGIRVRNPYLLLEDIWSGAGMDGEMNFGDVYIRSDDICSDDDAEGYSWDEVCGLNISAFQVECEVLKNTDSLETFIARMTGKAA